MTNKQETNVFGSVRTTMTISLTAEDRQFLKVYAAQQNKTISALIHEYVDLLREEK